MKVMRVKKLLHKGVSVDDYKYTVHLQINLKISNLLPCCTKI